MAKFIGRNVALGLGRETTRGTPVSPTHWFPQTELSFDDKVEIYNVEAALGTLEDSDQKHVLRKWAEGDVTGQVRSESFGLFLYSLMGTLQTTGPTDSAYSHAFTLANNISHPSLTLVAKDLNTAELYSLAMLNSIELTQELDAPLMFTAGFMSRTSKGTSATANYNAEAKFNKTHFSLKIANDLASLTASSPISVKSFSATISKNVAPDDALGTAEPEDFNNQVFVVEGSITLNYDNNVYKEYMRENTYKAMEFKWVNTDTDVLIGAGTNPSLTFRLPRVGFMEWEPNYALNEIVTQTIQFKGYYDLANDQSVITTCTLVNETTSY